MARLMLLALAMAACVLGAAGAGEGDGSPYYEYFQWNRQPSGLPNSFVVPEGYFENIPRELRPHDNHAPERVVACNNETIDPQYLDAYEFQTEEMLASVGLNLYDGSVWAMAQCLLGNVAQAVEYTITTLLDNQTLQFGDLKADRECVGMMEPYGDCTDPNQDGACGFCYGDQLQTLPTENAYFFRMISDYYCLEGTVDARCPELGTPWCWNDYKPVTGENSWSQMIGALQVEYFNAGKNVAAISLQSAGVQLAMHMFNAVKAMQLPEGPVLYCPYNTWDQEGLNIGAQASVENNVSLLAGLRLLYRVISENPSSEFDGLLPELQRSMEGITAFVRASYDKDGRYFRQGLNTTREWVTTPFATDCQTWTMSVLGLDVIDGWFGSGASLGVWNTTKVVSGYNYKASTGMADGVGFSENAADQVLSGEWTFGAVSMLRTLGAMYEARGEHDQAQELLEEAKHMETQTKQQLTSTVQFGSGKSTKAVLYANRRYWIEFGWWANPIPSTASTGWAVFLDEDYNPFEFGGSYIPTDPLAK
eukprot:TRINITY_DN2156_c0_g1_i1.p1 TRINITY_DN2156_c0_g1~~TRINITY_DN2156_c0_g1_i1.p1  ORF type:complete len:554 (+),score=187.65 TRINITY_DN2156_c0_g1_i1:59-1663(+)